MNAASSFPGLTPENIGVVVVTYHPTGDVESRLKQMRAQGGALVVVDNASDSTMGGQLAAMSARHGWELIANASNLGLGVALNEGMRRLAEKGCSWGLLFDQDSEPAPEMSRQMIDSLRRHPAGERVAVVGASFREPSTGRRHRILRRHPWMPGFFQKKAPGDNDMPDVTMVITSGSLVRMADFEAIGGFDEGFFIDHVDTDFCLRCRGHRRLIAVSAAARLDHSFGERATRRWGGFDVHPTNHPPLRHYYIARNRVTMIRRHGWRELHWLSFEGAAAGLWLFRVLAFERRKLAKLRAMVLGTWDGVRGRFGECPPERRRSLEP
jgi:rhamnosyltransferase